MVGGCFDSGDGHYVGDRDVSYFLTSTADLLTVTTSAAGTVDVHASWADVSAGVVTAGRTNTNAISTAAITTVVGSPAAATQRSLRGLVVSNDHATVTQTITVSHTDGANPRILWSGQLLAGEQVNWGPGSGWVAFDVLGRPKSQTAPAPTAQINLLADQVISGVDAYITGSDYLVAGRLKTGSAIRWVVGLTKTAAGIAVPIFNIRFGTAGAIADTARCIFPAGLAQTGAADSARITISATVRTYSATGIVQGSMGGDHRLAATGFSLGGFAAEATSAAFDLTVANLKAGISMNPGASAVWTVTNCSVEGVNLVA